LATELLTFIRTARTKGPGAYFSTVWTYLDLINLLLASFYIVLRVQLVVFIFEHPIRLPSNQYETTLELAAAIQNNLLLINALNIFEKILHLFKFFQFQDRMNILNATMGVALSDLGHFFVLFFLIMLGYCAMAYILFAPHVEAYSTIGKVIQRLGENMLGGFVYDELFEVDPLMGSIMFWTFIVLIFFTLVNVFLAILIDSYAAAKSSSSEDGAMGIDEDIAMMVRSALANRAHNVVRRDGKQIVLSKKQKNAQKNAAYVAMSYFSAKSIEKVSEEEVSWYMSETLLMDERQIYRAISLLKHLPGKEEDGAARVTFDGLLKHTWDKYDADGSGELSLAEFAKFLEEAPFKVKSEDIQAIMEQADSSGDGQISYAEFVPIFAQMMIGKKDD